MNDSVSRNLGIVVIQAQASGPSNHIPAVPILWERCQMGNRLRQSPQQPHALLRVALQIIIFALLTVLCVSLICALVVQSLEQGRYCSI